ncbi:MAG: cache domain-containing protein [Chloroflexota bacterium]|nr:cache domain-containing protein [Anaerolineales bacterium]
MAKTQKPNEEEKIVKENIQKRFKNMFTGENEPPSTMSIKEVDALKARVAELEERLGERGADSSSAQPTMPLPLGMSPNIPGKESAFTTAELDKRIALWITGILAVVGLVFFIFAIYIVAVLQNGMWELSDKVVMPFTAVMFLTSLIGFILARRNRPMPGVWLTYLTSIILGPILVILVLKDFYVIMGSYLALFSLIFIVLILPKRSRLLATFIAIGAALVMAGIDIWDPPFRLSTEAIQNFTLMVLGPAALGILALFFITNQFRNPGIQARLTVLVMTVMIPLLVIVGLITTSLSQQRMDTGANSQLQGTSTSLAGVVSMWLESNISALQDLASQPDIVSMDASQQLPVLKSMANAYPYMYLVATTDLKGMNVARSDNAELTDYSDRDWFMGAKSGAAVTYQSVISRTTGQPVLVLSTPVKNSAGRVTGVAMFGAELTTLAEGVQVSGIGERGFTFIVDAGNRTLAHPDTKVTAALQDMSNYPPVAAARQGSTGLITFLDENGNRWRAYATILDNGWMVIAQQPESEIVTPVRQFQTVVFALIMVVSVIMIALVWFAIRRTLQPISALTDTASAIAAGDLNRAAEVNTRDEIGILANTFNAMTSQLRTLVGSLEQRVADRTHDLELAAEVGRTVTEKVIQLSDLLSEAVEMIRARFDLYYTQIYLTDPATQRIILRAGTGEAGKELLQRGHNLIINSGSLNGRAVLEKRAQVVGDTRENPHFLPNRLLPNTRSEMCVPLIVNEEVVGVLDMQSEQPGVFSESNLPAFEALAGQIAVAVRNAALFAEVQDTRAEVEAQVSHFTTAGWENSLNAIDQPHRIGFAFDNNKIVPLKSEEVTTASDTSRIKLPITVTGTKVGEIQLPASLKSNDLELVNSVSEQLAQHVENLRLLAQAERYQKEAEQALRRLTHEGWDNFLSTTTADTMYTYDLNQVQPLAENSDQGTELAFKHPLVIRDETIGELKLDLPEPSDEDLEIISAVAQQLSGHLETLRLSELTEKHAQREQTLRQLTSALRSSTNPTTIMRTAVREVGRLMGRKTVVQVVSSEQINQNETDSPADLS